MLNRIVSDRFLNDAQNDDYRSFSVSLSIFGHLILAMFMLFSFDTSWGKFEEPIVYSVSIEGGKQLGGVQQVPVKDAKSQIAPVKKTSSQEKEEQKVQPVVEKIEKKDIKIPEAEKGEVQIKKEQIKPKDQPKPKEAPKKEVKKTTAPTDPNKQYQEALQRYLGESSNAGGGAVFGAAALGGSGMGGGVVRPPEFFAYLKKLEEFIKSGWIWNDNQAPLVTQVVFEMGTDGRISGVTITKGSGNRSYDDSVLRAIAKASPAPPPPASVYEFFRNVRMTFDPRE